MILLLPSDTQWQGASSLSWAVVIGALEAKGQ